MADAKRLRALRVLLVTDGSGDTARIEQLVMSALTGGVLAVQLREPSLSARQLGELCARLLGPIERHGGLLLVNDRVDVAAAGLAHGAQVGHRSLPLALARNVLGARCLLGASVHDAAGLAAAAAAGADFALLAPVWATTSKPGQQPLGPACAGSWTSAARLPVVWLGGVTTVGADAVAALPHAERPLGVAVRAGICAAVDPESAARALALAWARVLP